ncbi:MAG TPA: DNA polymerase III subunit gamma/tau [Candidatus Caccocola faecipullorum]|nr:DNA polymerase III subunit gamma/tau [Candidatus Caccocola faecipullorum]
MYISLYRRYRPQTFSDMVGQSAAVGVLMESLREGSLGHAYLFSGPRGCGKTSAARLVAKSLDCLNRKDDCEPCGVCENCRAIAAGEHLDVIEIDGASNRGIGEIRDLKSHVNLKPLSAAYKVYIIDEVHMLTEQAFNALLKTLEEPPSNVVFLLATTEPHKVPVTIRSRCQHIPFHRITIADTVDRLKYVCAQENIEAEDEAVWELARQADGALRDALSLTEQAVALGRGRLSLDSVKELTGGSSRTELEKWVAQMRSEPQKAAAALHSIMARGISPERLCESLFALFRDLWLYSLWGEKALEALETSSAERDYLASEAAQWDAAKLRAACELCNGLLPRAHYGMKGDIFSGVIFMELQSIINGEVRAGQAAGVPQSRAASPAAPQSRTTGPERYAAPQPRAEGAKPAPAAEAPAAEVEPAPQPQSAPQEAEPALPTGGAELFWKLASLIDAGDRIAISSALLNAAIVRGANGVEIEFEKETPARNFLSIAHNRKTLCAAAAKLWNLEGAAESEQPQPESASRAPVQEMQQPERGPRQREEAQPARTAAAPLSNILRRAGAELLYVRSAEMNEEETTEGNE